MLSVVWLNPSNESEKSLFQLVSSTNTYSPNTWKWNVRCLIRIHFTYFITYNKWKNIFSWLKCIIIYSKNISFLAWNRNYFPIEFYFIFHFEFQNSFFLWYRVVFPEVFPSIVLSHTSVISGLSQVIFISRVFDFIPWDSTYIFLLPISFGSMKLNVPSAFFVPDVSEVPTWIEVSWAVVKLSPKIVTFVPFIKPLSEKINFIFGILIHKSKTFDFKPFLSI